MFYTEDKTHVFFDCDDTLVMWDLGKYPDREDLKLEFNCYGVSYYLLPHIEHIERLKKHKSNGNIVVVWSASGSAWAKQVVDVLKLNQYVDIVISKPTWYYDDLKQTEFLPDTDRVYIEYK